MFTGFYFSITGEGNEISTISVGGDLGVPHRNLIRTSCLLHKRSLERIEESASAKYYMQVISPISVWVIRPKSESQLTTLELSNLDPNRIILGVIVCLICWIANIRCQFIVFHLLAVAQ